MENTILDFFEEYDQNVKVVIVKTFYWESQAYLYAARLKEAGINNFISNSNLNSVLHLANGGVTLHVREVDVDAANEIIKKLDLVKTDPEEQDFRDADHADIAYQKEVAEVERRGYSPYIVLLVAMILILLYAVVHGLKLHI